jgi:hypothetical protein
MNFVVIWLGAALATSAATFGGAATAEPFTSEPARFGVDFPEARQYLFSRTDPVSDRTFSVSFIAEVKPVMTKDDLDRRYDATIKTVLKNAGATLMQQKRVKAGAVSGWEVLADVASLKGPRKLRQQFFFVDNRVYQVAYRGPPGTEAAADVEAFFTSFQIR